MTGLFLYVGPGGSRAGDTWEVSVQIAVFSRQHTRSHVSGCDGMPGSREIDHSPHSLYSFQ